jgi:hypothetical protein
MAPPRARQLATILIAAREGGLLLSRAAKDATPMEAIGDVLTEIVRSELGHHRARSTSAEHRKRTARDPQSAP